ncbi:MAG: hypothetical protein AAF337_13410 [Pseudomonadota bacterium]
MAQANDKDRKAAALRANLRRRKASKSDGQGTAKTSDETAAQGQDSDREPS